MRRSYDKVTVFVSSLRKSAGTLICLGAHEVVISGAGELGPLDVQVREENELSTVRSGLGVPKGLDFLESRMLAALQAVLAYFADGGGLEAQRASQIAVNTTVGLFAPIYSKIDPAGLGETSRALAVAQDYAKRLVENLRPRALERLVSDFWSHLFVIDIGETKQFLLKVREPTDHQAALARHRHLTPAARRFRVDQSSVCHIAREVSEGSIHEEGSGGPATDPPGPEGPVGPTQGASPKDEPEGSDASEG